MVEKLLNLGQTSACFCLAKGNKYIQLWQIHVTCVTNPCRNFDKSNKSSFTTSIDSVTQWQGKAMIDKNSAPKLFCMSLPIFLKFIKDELGEVRTDDKSLRIFYCLLNFSCFILQHQQFNNQRCPPKGRVTLPNRMNFQKSSKEGGVIFNTKFILQILNLYKGLFSDIFRKNCNMTRPKDLWFSLIYDVIALQTDKVPYSILWIFISRGIKIFFVQNWPDIIWVKLS